MTTNTNHPVAAAILTTLAGIASLIFTVYTARSNWWPNINVSVSSVKPVTEMMLSFPIGGKLYRLDAMIALDETHVVFVDTGWRGTDAQQLFDLGKQTLVGKSIRVAASPDLDRAVWKQPPVGPTAIASLFFLGLAVLLWIQLISKRPVNPRTAVLFISAGFFFIGLSLVASHFFSNHYDWTDHQARVVRDSIATTRRGGRRASSVTYLNLNYVYEVNGQSYTDGASLLGSESFMKLQDRYGDPRTGDVIPIRVDPQDPQKTVVPTGLSWILYVWTGLSALFAFIGFRIKPPPSSPAV